MKTINLMLACNDDQGNFAEQFEALEVETSGILDLTNITNPIACKIVDSKLIVTGSIKVLGLPDDCVSLQILQHATWVGNCVWDRFTVPSYEAYSLLDYLRCQEWQCDQSISLGEGKCFLGDLWDERTMTLDDLLEAISNEN